MLKKQGLKGNNRDYFIPIQCHNLVNIVYTLLVLLKKQVFLVFQKADIFSLVMPSKFP